MRTVSYAPLRLMLLGAAVSIALLVSAPVARAQTPAYQSCDSGQDYSLVTCGPDGQRPQISATSYAGVTVHLAAYASSNPVRHRAGSNGLVGVG